MPNFFSRFSIIGKNTALRTEPCSYVKTIRESQWQVGHQVAISRTGPSSQLAICVIVGP